MDIKKFVSETLKQIVDGVKEAQEYTKGTDEVIVPFHSSKAKIDFDVVVTVLEGIGTEGKVGISVWPIGAGVTGRSESSSRIVSQIKFEILIELPKVNQPPPTRQINAYND